MVPGGFVLVWRGSALRVALPRPGLRLPLLARGLLFPQDPGNRLELHVGRSLVDRPDLAIPVELLRGQVPRKADAPQPLDGLAGGLFRHPAAGELGHAGLLGKGSAAASATAGVPGALPEAAGVVGQELGRVDLRGHFRVLVLHALELRDGPAELLPVHHVGEGQVVEAGLGDPELLGSDPDPPLVENPDADLVALPDGSQDARGRDPYVFQVDGAGRAGPEAQLALGLSHGDGPAVTPLWPRERSTVAKTSRSRASLALEIQSLLPLRTKEDPSVEEDAVAVVARAKASEPAACSLRQKAERQPPPARRGSHSSLCEGVPQKRRAVLTRVFWMSTTTATEGSTRAISSMARQAAVKDRPDPPRSWGTSMPIKPWSKRSSRTSGSMAEASSMLRTEGARTSLDQARAASRARTSSSVKDSVMGRGGAAGEGEGEGSNANADADADADAEADPEPNANGEGSLAAPCPTLRPPVEKKAPFRPGGAFAATAKGPRPGTPRFPRKARDETASPNPLRRRGANEEVPRGPNGGMGALEKGMILRTLPYNTTFVVPIANRTALLRHHAVALCKSSKDSFRSLVSLRGGQCRCRCQCWCFHPAVPGLRRRRPCPAQPLHVGLRELEIKDLPVGQDVRHRVALGNHGDALLHDVAEGHLAPNDGLSGPGRRRVPVLVGPRHLLHQVPVHQGIFRLVRARAAEGRKGHKGDPKVGAGLHHAVDVPRADVVFHLVEGRRHGGHPQHVEDVPAAVVADPDGLRLARVVDRLQCEPFFLPGLGPHDGFLPVGREVGHEVVDVVQAQFFQVGLVQPLDLRRVPAPCVVLCCVASRCIRYGTDKEVFSVALPAIPDGPPDPLLVFVPVGRVHKGVAGTECLAQ
ncbi:unnamed protein product [Pseudo-nitzschia multistriata]|uniref:Uncharacterized protein n=1 Tax=Pseudo-nitzschia multistriata TaxID=183589 RepID=A0A448YVN9_9STRA|nr:unnamed protein product [Pseudo-nitzschia multistriata]